MRGHLTEELGRSRPVVCHRTGGGSEGKADRSTATGKRCPFVGNWRPRGSKAPIDPKATPPPQSRWRGGVNWEVCLPGVRSRRLRRLALYAPHEAAQGAEDWAMPGVGLRDRGELPPERPTGTSNRNPATRASSGAERLITPTRTDQRGEPVYEQRTIGIYRVPPDPPSA